MKKYAFVLLLGSLTAASHAQESSREPYMVKTLTSEAIQNVRVETTGGNIAVAGVDAEATYRGICLGGQQPRQKFIKGRYQKTA